MAKQEREGLNQFITGSDWPCESGLVQGLGSGISCLECNKLTAMVVAKFVM